MSYSRTTNEQIEKMKALYFTGKNEFEIADSIGCSRQTVRNVLEREGVLKVNHRSKKADEKVCPHCRAKGHNKGVRFCWKCGKDIRSEAILLDEELAKVMSCTIYLPAGEADRITKIISDVRNYLRRQG